MQNITPLCHAYSHLHSDSVVSNVHDYVFVKELICFNEGLKQMIYEFGIEQRIIVNCMVYTTCNGCVDAKCIQNTSCSVNTCMLAYF